MAQLSLGIILHSIERSLEEGIFKKERSGCYLHAVVMGK